MEIVVVEVLVQQEQVTEVGLSLIVILVLRLALGINLKEVVGLVSSKVVILEEEAIAAVVELVGNLVEDLVVMALPFDMVLQFAMGIAMGIAMVVAVVDFLGKLLLQMVVMGLQFEMLIAVIGFDSILMVVAVMDLAVHMVVEFEKVLEKM